MTPEPHPTNHNLNPEPSMEHDKAEQELAAEVETGRRAATAVVEHLHRMGAGAATIPVTVDGDAYEVIVRPAGMDSVPGSAA